MKNLPSDYTAMSVTALRKEARRRSLNIGKEGREGLIAILRQYDAARAAQRARMAADARYARAHASEYVGKLVDIGGDICHEVEGKTTYTYYQPGVVERVHSGTAWVRISEWEGRPGENHLASKLAKVPIVHLCPRDCGGFRDILNPWVDEAKAAPAKLPRRRRTTTPSAAQLVLF
jgi:hypothetical protein